MSLQGHTNQHRLSSAVSNVLVTFAGPTCDPLDPPSRPARVGLIVAAEYGFQVPLLGFQVRGVVPADRGMESDANGTGGCENPRRFDPNSRTACLDVLFAHR